MDAVGYSGADAADSSTEPMTQGGVSVKRKRYTCSVPGRSVLERQSVLNLTKMEGTLIVYNRWNFSSAC